MVLLIRALSGAVKEDTSIHRTDPEPVQEAAAVGIAKETAADKPGNRWNLTLGADEKDMIARITMLEAGGESDRGQQAVVEVICNRIYSPEFPNTVYEVLSQKCHGVEQFVTWKNRNIPAAKPSDRVKRNVEAVLNGETHILPFETLYFSRSGENEHVQEVIGQHVFCNKEDACPD